MHDDASQRNEPERGTGEHITERRGESLFAARQFAGAAPTDGVQPGRKLQKSGFQRVVLPVVLIIGVIGVIAWVSQNLPTWNRPADPTPPPAGDKVPVEKQGVVFYRPVWLTKAKDPKAKDFTFGLERLTQKPFQVAAMWDMRFPSYQLEYEPDDSGYYDFLFSNESGALAVAELGVQGCTCTQVQICVLPIEKAREHVIKQHERAKWNKVPAAADEADYGWKTLAPKTVVDVAPGQGGLVRLIWSGAKAKERQIVTIRTRLKDQGDAEMTYVLYGDMAASSPVKCYPKKLDFGDLPTTESVQQDFYCWSGTRPNFTIEFPDNDPCVHCSAELLSPADCARFTKEFMKLNPNSRVLTGYKVSVTVTPKKDKYELDMGWLHKQLVIKTNLDCPVDAPWIEGIMPGDVRINGKPTGVLDLDKFSGQEGFKSRKFHLVTDKGVSLKYISVKPGAFEPVMARKSDFMDETIWELTLSVKGNLLPGGPLKDSYVILESTRPGSPPHQIRLPLIGTVETSKL